MTFRPWAVAALSLGTLVAWTPRPPAPLKYKLDLKTTQVVNLAALGQGEQRVELSGSGFVSVTAVDSAGGQAVTVVLDSVTLAEGSPIPPDAVKAAAGTVWHAFRAPNGRVGEFTTETQNPVSSTVEGVLQQIFPPLKRGTGPGSSWTDTTETVRNGSIAVRTVTNFQTSADNVGGQKVTRLAGASASSISGSQEGPQGTVQIAGTGTGSSSWVVGADGTCVSGTYSGTQSLQVTISMSPEPLPLTVTIEGNAALLK
ncbi:MAG TPA: hypothetical protein VG692_03850 [Gemmatimonadales bacterium]|nr:hypothetical protein [Gemmatimonadales bacterium]